MQTQELKTVIKTKATAIKDLKKELRKDHSTLPNSSGMQYSLWAMRQEIRVLYLVYGWFRGQRADEIERGSSSDVSLYHAKKFFNDDAIYELFKEWMKSTSVT